MIKGVEMRACGIEWFGVDKVVLFSDAAENSSLEVESAFHFAALWTRQRIETEIDAVVYHEEAYGWCAGTTPGMPAATQQALCSARRLMWACTVIYLLIGGVIALLSCGASAAASPRRRRAPSRLLAHGLTALAAAQLLAGVALSWMWSTIKRGVEAYFTANYTEVNGLVMRVGWAWYLAGFAGLATSALLLLSLRLSCLAQRRHHAARGEAPTKPITTTTAGAAGNDDASSVSTISRVPSNSSFPSAASSRASSRASSPVRTAAAAARVSSPGGSQQQQERRYPLRHSSPPGGSQQQAQRVYHFS